MPDLCGETREFPKSVKVNPFGIDSTLAQEIWFLAPTREQCRVLKSCGDDCVDLAGDH
jgi:hypothetical protein